ncbi:BamA/TamA family outer membrane protein [Tenacibaculum xiamenense]|uniref:hypothetical protein n=1 Tax=Tenacibaculum xiamenense TaxID=1261553 RepID=UPI0038940ADF
MNFITSTLSFLLKHHSVNKLTLLLLLVQYCTYSQEYSLLITSSNKNELKEIEKVNYIRLHSSEKSMNSEVSRVKKKLNSKGYLKIQQTFKKQDSIYTYFFHLGNRINLASIKKDSIQLIMKFEELETYLVNKKNELDSEGKSFTEVKLSSIKIKNDTLFAELDYNQRKTRLIDKVIIKGYENFPKSYLEHFLNIKTKTYVSKKKLRSISKKINTLDFAEETNSPQLLFSKDSTFLFLYLKKKYKNYFDGFINASPKDNTVKINGQLSLGLSNIFNGGENFNINWNSTPENTSFNATIQIPYLFNSPITPELSFNIFKQDSTFLNSELKAKLSYQLSAKSILSTNYEANTSSNLLNNIRSDVSSFNNTFYGISFKTTLKEPQSDFSENSYLETSFLYGTRDSDNTSTNQIKFLILSQHTQKLSNRSSLFFQSQIGYLKSDSYLENELFRLGGPQSIRGFLPNSIPASKYAILKSQYNYLINSKTKIYPLIDITRFHYIKWTNLLSTGIGYSQLRNNTLFNIEYAIGKNNQDNFNFNNSFLSIKVLTYF